MVGSAKFGAHRSAGGLSAAKILTQRKQAGGWNVWGHVKTAAPLGGMALFVGLLSWVWHLIGGSYYVGIITVATDLLAQKRLKVDWSPTMELRYHLVCNARCVGKTTKSDEDTANMLRGFREASGDVIKNWTLFVEDMCVQGCLVDHRKGKLVVAEPDDTAESLLPEIQEYFTCASSCRKDLLAEVSSGRMAPDAAGEMLRKCGVAHVLLSSASDAGTKLLHSLQQGYEQVRNGALGPGLDAFVDRVSPPLRNGREEVWLPYVEPFTNFTDILSMGAIGAVVAQHFNHSIAVVDHVNIVNAPGRGVATRQDIHSDTKRSGAHLEVHLPLLPEGVVPLGMGPTRFCPCMHGLVSSGNAAKRALRQYFGDNGTCLEFEELSWTLHAGTPGVRSGPWVTLYDADIHHQGLENISPKDRPVFVVALAESRVSVRERGYSEGRQISDAHASAMERFRGVGLSQLVHR